MPEGAAHSPVTTSSQRLEYDVVDVFTDRAFAGNPLAVVYGAGQLSSAALLAIAREFNLSETTFPTTPSDIDRTLGADYAVRIFTPGGEIPFAGHPTLGTAWSLCRRGEFAPGNRRQACGAGLIGVHVPDDPGASVELCAIPRDLATRLSPDAVLAVAESVGLRGDDVIGPAYVAGCGLSFVHLRVSPAAVVRARPGPNPISDLQLGDLALVDPLEGISIFSASGQMVGQHDPEVVSDAKLPAGATAAATAGSPVAHDPVLHINARVFVPGLSVPEDPATGSAAAGLGIVLCALGFAAPEGETRYRITQGVDMGRPSVLQGRVEASGGEPVACRVAGQVVPVASGTIAVPPPPSVRLRGQPTK